MVHRYPDRHPWDPGLGMRRPKLTDTQRQEIREKFTEAREEEPELTKLQFATRVAGSYEVSVGTIRGLLNNI